MNYASLEYREEFSDKVFPIKPAFARALVDPDLSDGFFDVLGRDNLSRSSVFGPSELQNANVVTFFPFMICFLAHVANFTHIS
jgi:hypothetical protein